MKFTLHMTPANPRAFQRPMREEEVLGPVVTFEAADEAAALVEAKKRMLEMDAKVLLSEACLCTGHIDLTPDLKAAKTAKVEAAEKAQLAALKAKYG